MFTIGDIVDQVAPEYPSIEWCITSNLTIDKSIQFAVWRIKGHGQIVLLYSGHSLTIFVSITEFIPNDENGSALLNEICEKLNQQLDMYRICLL